MMHVQEGMIRMAEGYRGMKTEHAGAKNGGGAWMRRAEAKRASRKRRRTNEKDIVRDAAKDVGNTE